MKVYVVTAGEYSDYHIVGVATTMEAEYMAMEEGLVWQNQSC